MKVLSIGSDRKVFESQSAVSRRISLYGSKVEGLHTVVFSLNNIHFVEEKKLTDNVFVYPTRSASKLLALIDAIRIGKKLIKEKAFSKTSDIITVQDPFESGLVGLVLSVVSGLKLHVQIHTDLFSPYFIFHSILNFIRVIISIPVILMASSVRVVSRRIADRMPGKILFNKDALTILPIFVPAPSEKNTTVQNLMVGSKSAIISVARLESEKDWETSIKAFSKVVKEFPDVRLFIYGSGSCEQFIRSYSNSLGLSEKVVLKGWQSDQRSMYEDAAILLVSSKYEGFGMVYIEAALNNVPVVSTEVGIAGLELVNGIDMLTSPVADAEGLAQNMIKLLKDGNLAKKIAAQAHESVLNRFITDEGVYLNNIVESWSLTLKK